MRYEQQGDIAAERGADFLFHLRDMAMIADLVGAEIFVDLGKQLLHRGGPPRSAGARLRVDDDRRWLDQVAPNDRRYGEQRPGRKASRRGDPPCVAKYLA